jgi:hypothetical protein
VVGLSALIILIIRVDTVIIVTVILVTMNYLGHYLLPQKLKLKQCGTSLVETVWYEFS